MDINNKNYFDKEMSMEYMGASQFKEFVRCPACALARVRGEIQEEKTDALLMGSYIDAYFSNEMDDFKASTPEIFTTKGTLKSQFTKADEIIKFIEEDEMMMKYLNGEKQVVMTGVIAGVKFKIKIDAYHPDKAIVDQKIIKDFELIWDDAAHCKKNFVDYWGYDIQGAIYQEIVYQNTGKRLPFILCVATKEKVPNKALLIINQSKLDAALEYVKEYAPTFDKMKKGEIEVTSCGNCDYCKSKKKVTGIFDYEDFFARKEENNY